MTLVSGSVRAQIKVSSTYEDDDEDSIGLFTGGVTAAGTFLPYDNQPDPGNPTITYAGGVGIADGIVLCTGQLEGNTRTDGYGEGIQGPNNGDPIESGNLGEVSYDTGTAGDDDFFAEIGQTGYNACALEFDVDVSSPGFFKITAVFGSDEYDAWEATWNDSLVVRVIPRTLPSSSTPLAADPQNILLFRELVDDVTTFKPLAIFELADCAKLFLKNEVASVPSAPLSSDHANGGSGRYDHEFGGFSIPLTRQSGDRGPDLPEPCQPGRYTIKIVIQDVSDEAVDAAAFIKANSFKFVPVLAADFNLDGVVNVSDFNVYNGHKFTSSDKFTEGDANGDGSIDTSDFNIWNSNYPSSGGYVYQPADFNDDGVVDVPDWNIWNKYKTTTKCASRFEGDADGDGDVDDDDEDIWDATKFEEE